MKLADIAADMKQVEFAQSQKSGLLYSFCTPCLRFIADLRSI